jgi:hypothetical protein
VLGVAPTRRLGLVRRVQTLHPVLPDRLQHPEAVVGVTKQALLDSACRMFRSAPLTQSAPSSVQPPAKTARLADFLASKLKNCSATAESTWGAGWLASHPAAKLPGSLTRLDFPST